MLELDDKSGHGGRAPSQSARAFQQVLRDVFGVPFALFDAATGLEVPGSAPDRAVERDPDPATVTRLAADGQAVVVPHDGHSFRISLVLHAAGAPILVAIGVVEALAGTVGVRAVEQARLQAWARDFSERLRLRDHLSARVKADTDVRTQLNEAWKVNLTLGDCMHRLRFNRHEVRDRQRILQTALQLLSAQALAWVPVQGRQTPLIAGTAVIPMDDFSSLARHLSRNPDGQGSAPYLCNDPRSTSWGARFLRIDNLLAFNVAGRPQSAWLIALNKNGKPSSRAPEADPPRVPFRNGDAALLSPFVSMLDMHGRAAGKFDEIRTLLVGLARSLTAAIDAKDAYTAGHSERVARLAVEIGREMQLPDEQLSDTYLAGLFHDVGKIGIRETVLCKPGQLSAEEFDHIKQHVTIGYNILQELQPIRHLLPGVLHHHERFDGRGYPDGLRGEKIPFLARLLAVADGFDAMNSSRPYRPALSEAHVFAELDKGAGTHWDSQIVAAALRCKQRLVAITHRGLGDSLRHAVDVALRTGESSMSDVR